MSGPAEDDSERTHGSDGGDEEESRSRDARGRYTAEHSPEDVLSTMEAGEPYTTGELVDATGFPRRTVYEYLDRLAEQDEIRKKKPSQTQAIWIRPPK